MERKQFDLEFTCMSLNGTVLDGICIDPNIHLYNDSSAPSYSSDLVISR